MKLARYIVKKCPAGNTVERKSGASNFLIFDPVLGTAKSRKSLLPPRESSSKLYLYIFSYQNPGSIVLDVFRPKNHKVSRAFT
jgi:hypothetical protein